MISASAWRSSRCCRRPSVPFWSIDSGQATRAAVARGLRRPAALHQPQDQPAEISRALNAADVRPGREQARDRSAVTVEHAAVGVGSQAAVREGDRGLDLERVERRAAQRRGPRGKRCVQRDVPARRRGLVAAQRPQQRRPVHAPAGDSGRERLERLGARHARARVRRRGEAVHHAAVGIGRRDDALEPHLLVAQEDRARPGEAQHRLVRRLVAERLVAEAAAAEVDEDRVAGVVLGQREEVVGGEARERGGEEMPVEPAEAAARGCPDRLGHPQPVPDAPGVRADRHQIAVEADQALHELRVALEAARRDQHRAGAHLEGPFAVARLHARDRPVVVDQQPAAGAPEPDLAAGRHDALLQHLEQRDDVDAVGDAVAHLARPALAHPDAGGSDLLDRPRRSHRPPRRERRVAVGCHATRGGAVRGRPDDAGRVGGRAAGARALLDHDDAHPVAGGVRGGGQPRHAAADDEQIGTQCTLGAHRGPRPAPSTGTGRAPAGR